MSTSKNIIKKTIQVGFSTLLSRMLGIIREILLIKYLGAGKLSDVFLTAYKIPNSLRKIFAEGALSAAFVPIAVKTIHKKNNHALASLMTLGFLFFEGIVLCLCIVVILFAHHIIAFIAPGFSIEQINNAVPLVRILIALIFFISSSALLAGALQATGHFFVPAFAPILINILFIIGIIICLFFKLKITVLCWFILFGGLVHFIAHLIAYMQLNFSFSRPRRADFTLFTHVITTFFLCLPSIGLMEFALFIDTSFASYLKPGSLSLLFYANRFVGIPLGVFAIAFSTILLPHFSRVSISNPQRLHFYLFEAAKFIAWIIMPVTLLMMFFSYDIFSTLFLSDKFTLEQVSEASTLLNAFALGLFSLSLNKIILNIFYALHATWVSALIALITTGINILLNVILIGPFHAAGLAYATTCASIIQTILFLFVLHKKYLFRLYLVPFFLFIMRYGVQLICFSLLFYIFYYIFLKIIAVYFSPYIVYFFTQSFGLWLWVGPLTLIVAFFLWKTQFLFKIRLYFLS